MIRKLRRFAIARIVSVCLLSAPWLHAAALDYLGTHASAVVVGSVTTRVEGPTQVSFTINIDCVLAGTIPGQTASVIHPWSRGAIRISPPTQTINHTYYGMWFLTAG